MGSASKVFVPSVQDPFVKTVSSILDPVTAARKAGTLKPVDVEAAQSALEDAVGSLDSTTSTFAGLGGKQAKSAAGSRSTLEGFIGRARDTLSQHLAAVSVDQPVDPNAPPAPTLDETGAPKRAQDLNDQIRKRLKAGGRQSTILTGPAGLTAKPKAQPTLLGGY